MRDKEVSDALAPDTVSRTCQIPMWGTVAKEGGSSLGSLQLGTASRSPVVNNVKKWFLTGRASRWQVATPANAWLHLLRPVAITNVCYDFVVCHLLPQDGRGLMCSYKKMGHG